MDRATMHNNEINLTPDFNALYQRFKSEARLQAENLFDDMIAMDCNTMAEKRDALRAVQAVLAPIAICINSATSREQIEDMRTWMNEIVQGVQGRADTLDNELNGRVE
jgi:hypothetical protein